MRGIAVVLDKLVSDARETAEWHEREVTEMQRELQAARSTCEQLRKERDGLKALVKKEIAAEIALDGIPAGDE